MKTHSAGNKEVIAVSDRNNILSCPGQNYHIYYRLKVITGAIFQQTFNYTSQKTVLNGTQQFFNRWLAKEDFQRLYSNVKQISMNNSTAYNLRKEVLRPNHKQNRWPKRMNQVPVRSMCGLNLSQNGPKPSKNGAGCGLPISMALEACLPFWRCMHFPLSIGFAKPFSRDRRSI